MNNGNAFDVVVIGGGTAGMTVAKLVASAGRRAALIEAERTGGDCLLTGCVPSKSLLAAARVAQTIRGAGEFGITVGQPVVDVAAVVARKDRIVERIGEADTPDALTRAGVTVIGGVARFTGPHTIAVGDRAIRGERFVIATGSRPFVPPIEGLVETGYVTNVEALALHAAPQRLAVIGGGPTGLELGQAFSRFGSTVTVIERGSQILAEHDAETMAMVQRALGREGIAFRLAHEAVRVERGPESKRLILRGNDGQESELDADEILVATGRSADVDRLSLETAGVALSNCGVWVNERMRTSVSHIWACGDVIGPPHLTHAAENQARAVAKNVLGGRARWDGRAIPATTYTEPEVASVGLSEDEARATYGEDVDVTRFPYSHLDRAVTDGKAEGLIKLLVAPGWMRGRLGGEVVGAHAAGEGAAAIVQQFAFLMAWRLPLGMLAKTVQAYPTYGLGARQAAGLHWVRTRGMSAEPSLVERLLAKIA